MTGAQIIAYPPGTRSDLHRSAFVGISPRLRLPFGVVPVKMLHLEARFLNRLGNAPGEMTAPGEPLIEWIKSVLPAGRLGIGSVAVLDEMERERPISEAGKVAGERLWQAIESLRLGAVVQ